LFSETNFKTPGFIIPSNLTFCWNWFVANVFEQVLGFRGGCKKRMYSSYIYRKEKPYFLCAGTNFVRNQIQLMRIEMHIFCVRKVSFHENSERVARTTHR
jgi:hypothetical protein